MTTILVYHRVEADRSVRSVTVDDLEAHFALIRRAGGDFVHPTNACFTAGERNQFLVTFDDGTSDHRNVVLDILDRHRISALFFIPTQKIGAANRVSSRDVVDLRRAGHCVGVHGHTHTRWDWLSETRLRSELATSRDILEDLVGERPRHTAAPGGFYSLSVQNVVRDLGFLTLRTMRWDLDCGDDAYALRVLPMTRMSGRMFLHAAVLGRGARLIRTAYRAKFGVRVLQGLRHKHGA